MRPLAAVEFPPEVEETYRRARRLEWITLAYLASTATLLFFTMGTSQAMRTSFFEDLVSLVPAAAFLVGTAIARRSPSSTYPYGIRTACIGRPLSPTSSPPWPCAPWACR